jgi:hypothetical protein
LVAATNCRVFEQQQQQVKRETNAFYDEYEPESVLIEYLLIKIKTVIAIVEIDGNHFNVCHIKTIILLCRFYIIYNQGN